MEEGVQFALECVLAAGLNEVLMKEPLNSLSSVCVSQSPSVFSLSPCLSSLASLLGSQLAQFLWPFDLSERVWSFKVLVFPLSGASLFLLSGLGFQSGGNAVPWLGGLEGWEWVGWGGWECRLLWGGEIEVRFEGGRWACDAVSLGQERYWHLTDPNSL